MQPKLDRVQTWFTANRLKLNNKKSNALMIGSRSKLSIVDFELGVSIDRKTLKFLDKHWYLGTVIDKEMSFYLIVKKQ